MAKTRSLARLRALASRPGATASSIAREMGVVSCTIGKWAKAAGIVLPSHAEALALNAGKQRGVERPAQSRLMEQRFADDAYRARFIARMRDPDVQARRVASRNEAKRGFSAGGANAS
jgi:hypothetical protein